MDIILSKNLSVISDAGKIPLKQTIAEEFVPYEDFCKRIVVRLTEPKNDFIVPLDDQRYFLFLGIDTVTSFRENEPLMRGKIRHEAGHVEYLRRDPVPSPGLIRQMKSFLGLDIEVNKIEFTSKLALQNALIDMHIISSSKDDVSNAYIQNYLQEHVEDIGNIPPKNSENFIEFCASVMQRAAVARNCTKRPWYSHASDSRLKEIIKMTQKFRDDKFQGTNRKEFDKGINILADSKKEYNWEPFKENFSSLIDPQNISRI